MLIGISLTLVSFLSHRMAVLVSLRLSVQREKSIPFKHESGSIHILPLPRSGLLDPVILEGPFREYASEET